jgi:predicted nucleic acid-binding protein
MEIVADASAFMAVVLDEVNREWVIERTCGYTVVSPEILPYEIANALTAIKRKGRLTEREVFQAFDVSQRIPVKLVSIKIGDALRTAVKYGIFAYDAFYLQCCQEIKLPLLSLDNHMCAIAKSLGIKVVT